jgi:hypothetical protein
MTDMPPPPPPPNYDYLGNTGGTIARFRGIGKVARALVILQAILAGVTVLTFISLFAVRKYADQFSDGRLSNDDFIRKIAPFVVAGVAVAAVSLAALVLECIWSFRMAKNLPLLGRQDRTWAPAWGIAGWILAGCTLGIIPYLMHSELWKGSDPDRAAGDPGWKREPVDPLLHLWLALTVVSAATGLLGGVGLGTFRFNRNAKDLAKELHDRAALNAVTSVLSVAAAIVFILFIRKLSDRHMRATREI